MILLLINIVVFARLGAAAVGVSIGLSVLLFLYRERIVKVMRDRLAKAFKVGGKT
ncbi:conserved hypothetical protein [Pseudomonas sp. 8Z]|nr:conserved hypothetical protein [Pseudomonas sp. 8Z]